MTDVTGNEGEQRLADKLANSVVRRIHNAGGELLHVEYRTSVQNKEFKVTVIVKPVAKEEKSGHSS